MNECFCFLIFVVDSLRDLSIFEQFDLSAMLTVLTLVLRSSAASPSVVGVVQSSEAGDHWKAQPDLVFAKDNFKNSSNSVSIHTKIIKQEVMGFGAAMTDTSAYNAMVWMDSDTQDAYFQALWGKTGLGLTLGRVTLNSVSEGQYTRGCNSEKDCRQFTIIKTNTAHCLFVFFIHSCNIHLQHSNKPEGRLLIRKL